MYFHWHGKMLALGFFQLSSRVWMMGQLHVYRVCPAEWWHGAAYSMGGNGAVSLQLTDSYNGDF